jgi:hypothetical protein
MKKLFLALTLSVLLSGCGLETKQLTSQELTQMKDDFVKQYPDIVSYKLDTNAYTRLDLDMSDAFFAKKLSEQYAELSKFFTAYKSKFDSYDNYQTKIETVIVGKGEAKYFSYELSKDGFRLISMDKTIDRKDIDSKVVDLDSLDKSVVMNGNYGGKIVKETSTTTSSSPSTNSSTTWNKTAGNTNGHDWATMNRSQKEDIVSGVLSTWKGDYTVDVNAQYFITALDSFYGSSATDDTNLAKAMSMIGISAKVVHKK